MFSTGLRKVVDEIPDKSQCHECGLLPLGIAASRPTLPGQLSGRQLIFIRKAEF
jgi:hypothetical protein